MIDDPTKLPPPDDPASDPAASQAPAPWSKREEGTVAGTQASDEGRASFLDDSQMSLGSKLRGGGKDLAPADKRDETRLCPACSTVSKFIDGKCSNCDFKLGSGGLDTVQEIRSAAIGTGEDPAKKTVLIVALGVVVILILVIGLPKLFGKSPDTDTSSNSGRPVSTEIQPSETFSGSLDEIALDSSFKANLVSAIEAGNAGWESEGTSAYVYRYSAGNTLVAATSQVITLQMYVGGTDAKLAAKAPGNVPFNLGMADLMDSLNARQGVRASFQVFATGGSGMPDKRDTYTRYGYYYGLEHMEEIQPIIDGLDNYYKQNGEYPHILKTNLINKSIRTKQGYFYISNGFGYLPIFKTDANGKIVMGTGSGLDPFNPDACIGYYLVKYTKDKNEGLDIHSKDNEHHYQQKIASFPYENKAGVENVVLTPDGDPDGIACVIKDGILLDQ